MKIRELESPTLYFPSDTFVMGNWAGQEHRPSISRTYRNERKEEISSF